MIQKKCKIRYKRLFIFLLFILLLGLLLFWFFNIRISNIYVTGNYYLTEQEVIEMGKLENYPRAFFSFSNLIESRISSSEFISSVSVKKKGFRHVYITVNENRPLFLNSNNETVFLDGSTSSRSFDVPYLNGVISDNIKTKFLNGLNSIDNSVYSSISEISYTPSSVDSELFLFTMVDGNFIYVNINKFSNVNQYFDMVSNFRNHKGILYLDSGEYFKILDN